MKPLAEYNLFDDATRECPFPYFQAIRQEAPVYYMPEIGAWYVSRYEDLRHVKKNPQIFSNQIYAFADSRGGTRDVAESYRSEHGWQRVHTLQRTDPPEHTKYRKLINHAFSVKRIRGMTAYVETIVNDLVDGFIRRGECDFVREFSVPLPCTVIADQLGVPRESIADLKKWSDAMLAPGGGYIGEAEALECGKLVVQAQRFFAGIIEERRRQPRDDIISDVVHASIADAETGEERHLTMHELLDLLDQLLTGGNETTTNAIASGLMLLLQRPGTMERLRGDEKLLRNFIEETLRYESPVIHLWRVTTQDTELGGVKLPKGSSLALGYASANRDEAVFEDGETFDIERSKIGAHLAFGSGPHHCPGAALARQEMFSTFTVLLNRLENIRLKDPADRFEHLPSSFLRGLKELQITFDVRNAGRHEPGASWY